MRMIGVHLVRLCLLHPYHSANSYLGAFVAAPIGGILWAFGACALRIAALLIISRLKGHHFDALDRPIPRARHEDAYDNENERVMPQSYDAKDTGKFF